MRYLIYNEKVHGNDQDYENNRMHLNICAKRV